MSSAFVAYASVPVAVAETVARGVAAARTIYSNLAIWTWQDLDIGGRLIRTEILSAIDQSDVLIADISSLNLNVVYEVGYAIGKGKPLRLIRNSTLDTFQPLANRVGIFDTMGFVEYTNSEELAEYLGRGIEDAKAYDIHYA